jgi:hypothetical protein
VSVLLLALLAARPATAQDKAAAGAVVEIRSYNLKPGTRDADSYFLIRAFPSLEARQKSEDAFYGSDEWKQGIREATLADIVNYTTVVSAVDTDTLRAMRKLK